MPPGQHGAAEVQAGTAGGEDKPAACLGTAEAMCKTQMPAEELMGVRDISTGTGRAPGGAEGPVPGTLQREGEHSAASPGLHSIHFKHFCFFSDVVSVGALSVHKM